MRYAKTSYYMGCVTVRKANTIQHYLTADIYIHNHYSLFSLVSGRPNRA